MSRLIRTGSASKDRILLERGVVLAIRELALQKGMDETTRDLLAYIAISLKAITETVEQSVAAWEKRGYWVKADHYRMEWAWTTKWGEELEKYILTEDWASVARITGQLAQKVSKVKVPQRNRIGAPWIGTYQKLISPNQGH